jgi:aromatic-L-amino-acid/L-tryptophan decarboxylase
MLARRLEGDGWRRVNDTPLPVVCVVNPAAEALGPEHSHAWHTAVADRVVASGQAWLSPVRLAGRAALRLCITSYRAHDDDIATVVTALEQARAATALAGEPSAS